MLYVIKEMPHQLVKSVDEENVIQPRVKWTGKARLGTNVYYNVTSSNNIQAVFLLPVFRFAVHK